MPIEIIELDDGFGNLIKAEGFLDKEEYLAEMSKHFSKPEEQMRQYVYSIGDYTKVTGTNVGVKELYKVAKSSEEIAKINPDAIIVIATNDNIVYGLAKLWMSFLSFKGWKINIFKSRSKLDIWLNKELNKFDSMVNFKFDKDLKIKFVKHKKAPQKSEALK